MNLVVDMDELTRNGFNQAAPVFVFALAFSLSISPDDLQRIVSAVMKGLSQFD